MLSLDEQKQKQWARRLVYEKTAELRARALANDIKSNEVTIQADAGRDVTNPLAQMGRPLTCQQVIDKLKLCNSHLRFERATRFPDLMGIYMLNQLGRHTINGEKVSHVMGMEAGMMPEFTVVHTATRDVPGRGKEKIYADRTTGWRTVLVRLLHAGFITQADVQTHFGWAPSSDSRLWHEQTS